MTTTENSGDIRNRERRARRALEKQGFLLKKSRVRNTHVDDWGGYMIIHLYTNTIECGARFDFSLEEIERFISGE